MQECAKCGVELEQVNDEYAVCLCCGEEFMIIRDDGDKEEMVFPD